MKSLFALLGVLALTAVSPAHGAEKASKGVIVVGGASSPVAISIASASGASADPDSGKLVITGTGTVSGGTAQVAGSGMAHAPADGKSPDVKVEAFRVGKVIEVGPDGKVEVKDIAGAMPPEMMKNLPKEIRDAIENMRAQSQNAPGNAFPGNAIVHGKMKVVVEKDGKRTEYETDLGDPQGAGVPLGGLQGLLNNQDGKVPPEALKALESVRKAMRARAPLAGLDHQSKELNEKLDKILDRLDHIESDLKKLKESEATQGNSQGSGKK